MRSKKVSRGRAGMKKNARRSPLHARKKACGDPKAKVRHLRQEASRRTRPS